MSQVQLGDVGTEILVTVKEDGLPADISTATVKKFLLQKKNRTTLVVDASFVTSGSDGQLHYFTSGSEVDIKGTCTLQVYLELPDGKWHTSKSEFTVEENLVATA